VEAKAARSDFPCIESRQAVPDPIIPIKKEEEDDDRPRAPDDRELLWLRVASDRGYPLCEWRRSLAPCHCGPAHLHGSALLAHAWWRPPRVARPQTISALQRAGSLTPLSLLCSFFLLHQKAIP
jgi:hypothetical protein